MRVGLIGAGNMARAIARGWGEPVLCCDSGSGRGQALVDDFGGRRYESSAELAADVDAVVLCHKPHQLDSVAAALGGAASAVVSVLGGVAHAELQAAYPQTPVYALMPNTPVAVRRGVLVYAEPDPSRPGTVVDQVMEQAVLRKFAKLGTVVRLPEALFDAATAVSGVGPAYQALVAEAQVDAAVRQGIPAAIAGRLVAETMAGTAVLLADGGFDTLALRRAVTSPGGSTARGLAALERGGLRHAFQAAADAVLNRPAAGAR